MKKNVHFAALFPWNLALITHNAPSSVNSSIVDVKLRFQISLKFTLLRRSFITFQWRSLVPCLSNMKYSLATFVNTEKRMENSACSGVMLVNFLFGFRSIQTFTFTYRLRAMWNIRPQHNPANHLCQPLPFVPHSSSSIPLFPFLSPLSFSMLSLVFPGSQVNAVLQSFCTSFLMNSIFHLLLRTSSLRFSISAIFRTPLFVILSCQRILNISLRHLLWKTSMFFSSHLFIFNVTQPYINTGFTSVFIKPDFGSSTDRCGCSRSFSISWMPLSLWLLCYGCLQYLHPLWKL